jgi:hypothetical protein
MDKMKQINLLIAEMWDIFHKHGGYEYNDAMVYQLQGMEESLNDCLGVEDLPNMLDEVEQTMKYFQWVKAMLALMETEPPQLYG